MESHDFTFLIGGSQHCAGMGYRNNFFFIANEKKKEQNRPIKA